MSQQPLDIRSYQRRAESAARLSVAPEPPEWGEEATALYKAGWDYLVRGGRRIWCRDAGDSWECWRSEEVAYAMLAKSRGEKT